ncbi:oxidoreductase [Halobaculum sp. MBLA0143]|uniref:oxidoreductase n=1 Tax=Halobaculum sp. MBLA0143 TaxID=3079933 RepID=UPI00352346DB
MADWTADDVPRVDDDVIVVTGANSGLGLAATELFAARGATVVMACRSTDRGQQAADEVRETTDDGELDVRECDLADLDTVAAFAEGVRETYPEIDVLCNNAGVMAIPRSETTDGFETQLGVNHMGHFALTGQLLPALVAAGSRSEPARIVTQSSGAHEMGEMDFDDLHWEESYSKWEAYGRSKLANLLFAYELDRRLDDHGLPVESVACHPGYAATNLQLRTGAESGFPFAETVMGLANRVLGQSAQQGALPMLYAAVGEAHGGAYVGPDGFAEMRGYPEIQESSSASYDEADARRLWERSVADTGVDYEFETAVTPA